MSAEKKSKSAKAEAKPARRWRRLRRVIRVLFFVVVALGVTTLTIVETGLADRWARRALISRVEKMTGGRVELGRFHFAALRLRAELGDLTVHGREPEGTPPLFHCDSMLLDIRVDSFLRRKVSLNEVRVEKPSVHFRVEANGRNNVPHPTLAGEASPSRPWRERIFAVVIRQLRLHDGEILYNDVRVPLDVEGGQFDFAMDYNAPLGAAPFYPGQFSWQKMILTARRYLPFRSDVAANFTLQRDSFELNQMRWELPHSSFDAQASVESLAKPTWKFRYRGQLNLSDIRTILRKPNTPQGRAEFSGEGEYAARQLKLHGRYSADEVAMGYQWFHARGMSSRGITSPTRRCWTSPISRRACWAEKFRGGCTLNFTA